MKLSKEKNIFVSGFSTKGLQRDLESRRQRSRQASHRRSHQPDEVPQSFCQGNFQVGQTGFIA